MNNIALGQYVDKNSIIHRLDPRTKLIAMVLLMVGVFVIPSPLEVEIPWVSFIALALYALFLLLVVLFTKISVAQFLKSVKQIFLLLMITFIVQIISPSQDKETILDIGLNITIINILLVILLWVGFILLRKYLKLKLLLVMGLLILSIYILTLQIGPVLTNKALKIYKTGLYTGSFFSLRVFLAIMMSSVLSLTTKPTDLTSALEWLLHPLTYLKLNVSIFAMMIAIALRFIPTLFNETQKILKAQSARGVDFKEGNIKSQVSQIIALLIPMFVVSFKRAADLADAMEARCYIPGAPRTKLNVMKFKVGDFISLFIAFMIITSSIVWKVVI